jgi:hypothetical protein
VSKYPLALATSADLPTRIDGSIIYGAHLNAAQDEIIAIQTTLGVGTAEGVPSILEGGFNTLAERLRSITAETTASAQHRGAQSGVHGVSGTVVGTTDTQTLTGKTLASPVITGTVNAGNVTVLGSVAFQDGMTANGPVVLTDLRVQDLTRVQHDHSGPSGGGRIPPSSVYDSATGKTLPQLLDEKSTPGHTHLRSEITDFGHSLSDHSGDLNISRVEGLGSSASMSVPTSPGTAANAAQLVRGDDPRLADSRTPKSHASSHLPNGSDPITPAIIGAALAEHTHTKSQITDFAHTLAEHSGNLGQSRIDGLATALAGKLDSGGTAINSARIGGKTISVQSTAPAGPAVGDVWIPS